jgi:hypothetical protein
MSLSLQWCVPASPGRTLFVVFAYHGRDRDAQPSLWTLGESANARAHRILHRDHYANPRTPAYQLALVAAVTEQLSPDQPPDAVIDRDLGEQFATDIAAGFGRLEMEVLIEPRLWRRGLAARAHEYQNVVLVFADALGLGCEAAEHRLLRDRRAVVVVNGRRRVFEVDAAFSRRLDWHRWLAWTRIVERGLAAGVRPLAALLATKDRLTKAV